MSLVRPILDYVLQQAESCGALAVRSVHLTIGDAHDVVEELIPDLFRHLARGTVAQNAEVVIERMPITARCNVCNEVFSLNIYRKETWRCPCCGAERNYHMETGREFSIDSISVVMAPSAVAV